MSDRHEEGSERVRRVAELTLDPAEGFVRRVRSKVNRRLLAGDLTRLSLGGLAHAFLQYLVAIFGVAESTGQSNPADGRQSNE